METKLSLQTISRDYLTLLEEIEENGGELTPENEQFLDLLSQEIVNKSDNYGLFINELNQRVEALKQFKISIAAKQKRRKTLSND